jgi:hypothetical protein
MAFVIALAETLASVNPVRGVVFEVTFIVDGIDAGEVSAGKG